MKPECGDFPWPRVPSPSPHRNMGVTDACFCAWLSPGSRGLNLSPHPCTARTLLTELSPCTKSFLVRGLLTHLSLIVLVFCFGNPESIVFYHVWLLIQEPVFCHLPELCHQGRYYTLSLLFIHKDLICICKHIAYTLEIITFSFFNAFFF